MLRHKATCSGWWQQEGSQKKKWGVGGGATKQAGPILRSREKALKKEQSQTKKKK